MKIDEYAALLSVLDEQIDAKNAKLLIEAADDLRAYAQQIGHEQSGHMVETMHRVGPFAIGQGAMEVVIESGAAYAEEEVLRGGDHDWATRTLNEQRPRITQLETDIENATIRALVGESDG